MAERQQTQGEYRTQEIGKTGGTAQKAIGVGMHAF
jgi:hypothetical protein